MTPAPPLAIRAARDTDAKAVIALLDTEGLETAFDPRDFIVADEAGRIVACARLRTFASGAHELASVAVSPARRRQGLGAVVVAAALARASSMVYALALQPGFFQAQGFQPLLVLPPELEEKARGMCAGTPFTAMRRAPSANVALAGIKDRHAHAAQGGSCCRTDSCETGAHSACDCTTGALTADEGRGMLADAGIHGITIQEGPARGGVGSATIRAHARPVGGDE